MKTRAHLVPLALGAMALSYLFLAGCGKKEEAPAVDPYSPSVYMKDTEFRQKLKARRQAAVSIGEKRSAVNAKIEALVKATGEKMKTSDRKAVEAALKDDAEWKRLQAEGKALDEEFEKNHRETLRTVRERIIPKASPENRSGDKGTVSK